ncbi:MAG TPA: SDR family NAD(P)-dependent oxidoreductase [Aggregatilineaceae bacterium]|nr:SDR family NAD(P)-dependent oxidoreductase [Aggregatilineaceae bacterium]
MFDFSEQVVLVTGAGGNLGSAVANAFRAAGARLALIDRQPDNVHAIFGDDSPDRLILSADLTNTDSVHQMVEQVLAHFGQLDVVANTVGGYRAGTPVHETPLETWDFMLNLNAKTAFLLAQHVIPPMLERGHGKIINVAARAGLSGGANMSAYSIAKSAVIRLTESLSAEYKTKGININCILPGTIDTPQNRAEMPTGKVDRWVQPEALADVILFLASDAARAVHGAAVPVYGLS